ncbi:MAG: hypothetical protein B6U73_03140 [Desulfurococcales archaeon ex4484_204]|nr:MAG: hypothetical protein B6U73_03140 [Desulfurococcales archaeon ex4484_204]
MVGGEKKARFSRMTIPKSEKDFEIIEREVRAQEVGVEMHPQEVSPQASYGGIEGAQVFIINAIAHTLGRIEADVSSIGLTVKELLERIDQIKLALTNIVKALLLRELEDPRARRELLINILRSLEE